MVSTLTPGLQTTGMGIINKESTQIDAGLFEQAIPANPSSNKILIDIFGASRTITINGTYTSSFGAVNTFIAALDNLVSGTQVEQTYTSDKTGSSFKGLIGSISHDFQEAEVNSVTYTITFLEGSV